MPDQPELAPGQTGEWVQYLQQSLQYVQLMTASEDGFGSATEAAVRRLQSEAGATETGRMDQAAWDALTARVGQGGGQQSSQPQQQEEEWDFVDPEIQHAYEWLDVPDMDADEERVA